MPRPIRPPHCIGPAPLKPGRWAARLGVGIAAAWLAVACSTVSGPHIDAAAVQAYAAGGYAAARHAVTVQRYEWRLGDAPVTVVLARPREATAAPLVIYLPALGEDAEAGAAWRLAWAGAGYAVLSVQPLAGDAQAWRSALAREGDFKALGLQRYAAAVLRRRVQRLAAVLDEARRRAIAGEPGWQGIDWDRRALAGRDLGAYTALALDGEKVDAGAGLAALVPMGPVRAVVAISPYAQARPAPGADPYAAVYGPVLSITSDNDGDPLGLLADPAQRRWPYDGMPGPDKALLLLRGLSHERLSGAAGAALAEGDDVLAGPESPGEPALPRAGRGRGQGAPGGGEAAGPASRPSGSVDDGAVLSPTERERRLTAAQQISTAFLDAYVRDDPLARAWLADAAPRWLGGAGTLQTK